MNDGVYYKLAKVLDTMPNGFSSTDTGVDYSEAPRPQGGGHPWESQAELRRSHPASPCGLRRGHLSPFLPVLPHGASWRRRVSINSGQLSAIGHQVKGKHIIRDSDKRGVAK